MRPIVEFCLANMSLGTDQVKRRLEQDHQDELDVIEYGCLGNCGQCFYVPYALVNGEIVAAETADQLYEKIMQVVRDIQDENAWLDQME